MVKLTQEQEKDAVDYVTNCMFSLDFLKSITDVIFGPGRNTVTVGGFYDQWLQVSGAKESKIPFNLGIILGYLYCGLLFTKENWLDLLPDVDLATADAKWGISGAYCIAPQMANPSLKYTVRRIRNALAHGNIAVDVPKDLKDRSELMTRVTLQFCDENTKDATDTFDIKLNLDQLSKFVRAFQSVIHSYVRAEV